MAQYWPAPAVQHHAVLGRKVSEEEYNTIKTELDKLGFYKGWVQELESSEHYLPDFEVNNPFG